jgi:hypothetical protein
MKTKLIFKALNIAGWILISISITVFLISYYKIYPKFDVKIEYLLLPLGIGFIFLFPLAYLESDQIRDSRGGGNYTYLSYSGKYLIFGIVCISFFLVIFL